MTTTSEVALKSRLLVVVCGTQNCSPQEEQVERCAVLYIITKKTVNSFVCF